MSRLSLRDVSKAYGATKALRRGDLKIGAGEVHALIGSNGSGKSTICKIIAGSIRPDQGEVFIDGQVVTVSGPQIARSLGIGIFYQELSLSANRTVAENICIADMPGVFGLFVNYSALHRMAEKYVSMFEGVSGEGFSADAIIDDLRADQRQIVEIMKTLATEAKILIFDEPTSALDRAQVDRFFEILRELKKDGRSIVFISHRMDEIFEIGDRITVIRDGETIATSPTADIDPDRVVFLMAGETVETPDVSSTDDRRVLASRKPIISARNISGAGFNTVSFDLSPGEILGFGGLHGQGQSAVLRALFGISPIGSGTLSFKDQTTTSNTPRKIIRKGCAYVSGDRRRDGLIQDRSILENVTPVHALRNHLYLASPRALSKKVMPALQAMNTKFSNLASSVASLSGGNQQKVVIARWLTDPPEVLILDDPTKGIDLSAKAELFALIRSLASDGMAIILYSSEETELLNNADRILVFNNGSVSRELSGEQCTRYNLYQAAYEAA